MLHFAALLVGVQDVPVRAVVKSRHMKDEAEVVIVRALMSPASPNSWCVRSKVEVEIEMGWVVTHAVPVTRHDQPDSILAKCN